MILCGVSKDDAEKLNNTIIEVNMCEKLYKYAMEDINCSPIALKTLLDYYMFAIKVHKTLWKEIAIQYVGEEKVISSFNSLRFDPLRQVIFQMECGQCKT